MTTPATRLSAVTDRQIGPVGTSARLLVGALAVALPIAVHGFSWSDAAVAFFALPVIALTADVVMTAALRGLYPPALTRQHGICSMLGCPLVGAIIVGDSALATVMAVNATLSVWVFLGASMLLAAARGYGGCEILAIPNLITGRQDRIGCILYTPLDAAEARRRARTRTTA